MHIHIFKKISTLLCGALFASGALFADVIDIRNGSRLTGTVTHIDSSTVVINTDFAGDIKVKQSEIASITTDAPVNVRLSDGRVLTGVISGASPSAVTISGAGSAVAVNLSEAKESWAIDAKDPEVAKRERKWSFEAGMDVSGKTGNSEQLGTNFSFRATLASSFDTLQLYTAYDRQITDKTKSADQFRIGGDYQRHFSERFSWYARDEAGFDRVKNVDLYNNAAAGIGYDVVRTKIDTLTFRAGLSHRYERYGTVAGVPAIDDLSEFGLDLGLINQLTMKNWSMTNRITYMPAFSDFGMYRIFHESFIELPMASPRWKFRVGVSNDYNSHPASAERLDTTYFARLLMTWK